MFPCHFKIPGHSGTDFKHRKAFQKSRKRLEVIKRTNGSYRKMQSADMPKNAKGYSKISINKPLKWLVAAVRLTMFFLLILLIKNIVISVHQELTTNTKKITLTQAFSKNSLTYMEIYYLFVKEGNNYLDQDKLNEAHQLFAKAWNLDRYGFEANLGMTKVLLKKCKSTGEYCSEAEAYLIYIKKIAKLTDNQLIELQELYVSK